MKRTYPGDPEFTWDRFYQLPYEYVLAGYNTSVKARMKELHENEMPIALNTAVYANSQRDPKSNKKPYDPMDFAFYEEHGESGPRAYYAACYMHLVEKKEMPPWALFCLKDISSSARGSAGPIYALKTDDAILIGPKQGEGGFTGLLIALESAGGQKRDFVDPKGNIYTLKVPHIPTKVVAKEDVTLS